QRYCFIPQTIVENAVKQCNVCITRHATKQMPAMKPIIAEKFLAYVQ
ncbi:18902_t:CDS:1, partial [Dentiscutata erythropus]